jgi:hypothetical protein
MAWGAGYAAITTEGPLPTHGLLVQAEGAIGLGDLFELRFLASWAFHPGVEPLHRGSGGIELVYLVDVFQWVPFLGVGLDVPVSLHVRSAGGTDARADLAGHFVAGVDWLPERNWALGIEIRPYLLLTSLTVDPLWITALLRLQLLFET